MKNSSVYLWSGCEIYIEQKTMSCYVQLFKSIGLKKGVHGLPVCKNIAVADIRLFYLQHHQRVQQVIPFEPEPVFCNHPDSSFFIFQEFILKMRTVDKQLSSAPNPKAPESHRVIIAVWAGVLNKAITRS